MTTTDTGHRAEEEAAEFLKSKGYKVLARNWRTRWCEIDIIAQKDKVVSFVEVKYRHSAAQGSGLEYITPKKLRQMRFAAEFWAAEHHYDGDCVLAGIEVSGAAFQIAAFIESID